MSGGSAWSLVLDTNIPDQQPGEFPFGEQYAVTGRSLLLFALAKA